MKTTRENRNRWRNEQPIGALDHSTLLSGQAVDLLDDLNALEDAIYGLSERLLQREKHEHRKTFALATQLYSYYNLHFRCACKNCRKIRRQLTLQLFYRCGDPAYSAVLVVANTGERVFECAKCGASWEADKP